MPVASRHIQQYFEEISKEVDLCYSIANDARSKLLDPAPTSEIMLAHTMAERVIGLVSMAAPQLLGTDIPKRVEELEKEYGALDWRVGFKIAVEVAQEKFCKFEDKREAMEVGIRTGFAYLTLGIVAAPLEGFVKLDIKQRKDGKEYFGLNYAGPVRGAGGTASSTSVILADYVRVQMGYAPYDPQEKEVSRYITEVHDYHDRITNLQYHPSDDEIKFMVSHLPVEVTGDPTERIEVSNYKDLERIPTNLIRGGMCLVVAEGLCQKAPKLWKRLSKWGKDMDLEWGFLGDFLKLKEKIHAKHGEEKKSDSKKDAKPKVKANNTFIMDIVAGRPVLTDPIQTGGFRLRYGRGRTSGFSASAAHPATMVVVNDYLAIGTQLKIERPGKGCTITACDSIESPIVRLKNGSVIKLTSAELAKKMFYEVDEVLFLGDILFNYGDFSENGQKLVPAGYCPEWWVLEVENALKEKYSIQKIDETSLEKFAEQIGSSTEDVKLWLTNCLYNSPPFDVAHKISQEFKVPLHPEHLLYYDCISFEQFKDLCEYFPKAKVKKDAQGKVLKIVLPYSVNDTASLKAKRVLEELGALHEVVNNESIVLAKKEASLIATSILPFIEKIGVSGAEKYETALDFLAEHSSIELRAKGGTFIGARMGRPEKAKMRSMKGSPHGLFPIGEEGGRLRSFQAALQKGYVESAFPSYFCSKCVKASVYLRCDTCNSECTLKFHCRTCGDLEKETCRHGNARKYRTTKIDVRKYFSSAKERLGETLHPDLIKGVRGTSNRDHTVEHLSKAILRAKHRLYVNKDGTTRYDMTELPITHFKPKEIQTSVSRLKELGYLQDIHGKALVDDNQLLEIKPQDVIMPGFDSIEESSSQVLIRVAQFIDELLVKFYGLEPYYNVKEAKDLAGHLIIGLAPHISAGTVGRIIGFSQTQGMITHPMYHAGLRRDCDGDEAAALLLLDGLLNFSKKFLPSSRGSTMDAPLVLTPVLDPAEVDDQVLGVDVMWRYPLEFYEASLEMKAPWEVRFGKDEKKIEQLDHRLGKENQYEDFGFTHPVDNFNKAVQCSAYKTLPTMKDKLFGQMDIAQKVRAVNMGNVARLVIQRHFLADIKGNLRKFSMQTFRCSSCNAKYRRPPLSRKCTACKSPKLLFTISEGSVVKYLEPSMDLAKEYDFSPYLKETIHLLKSNINAVFGKGRDKQTGLGAFMVK